MKCEEIYKRERLYKLHGSHLLSCEVARVSYGGVTSLAKEQLMIMKLKTYLAEFALSEASQKNSRKQQIIPLLLNLLGGVLHSVFIQISVYTHKFPNSGSQNWSSQVQITAHLKVLLDLIISPCENLQHPKHIQN